VGEAEDGTFGRVGEALDFPAVREDDCETTARPRPAPFWLVVKYGLKISWRAFGRHAGPSSRISSDTWPGPSRAQ